jgi:DNA-binding MarR family transcriptional regulator
MSKKLEDSFIDVYNGFKLEFYRRIFNRFETREASLTAIETFCVEVINAMGTPTIGEFADFVHISQANAAYKVQSLVKKGYVNKIQSKNDKREYHLQLTQHFEEYNNLNTNYIQTVMKRFEQRFSKEDTSQFKLMLDTISDELMPETHRQVAS